MQTLYPDFMASGLAKCADADPELFSRPERERGRARERRVRAAARLCRQCPLQRACLAWGRTNRQQGVYGGEEIGYDA